MTTIKEMLEGDIQLGTIWQVNTKWDPEDSSNRILCFYRTTFDHAKLYVSDGADRWGAAQVRLTPGEDCLTLLRVLEGPDDAAIEFLYEETTIWFLMPRKYWKIHYFTEITAENVERL